MHRPSPDRRAVAVPIAALAAGLAGPAAADDIEVPGDAPTIQAAIELAEDGDRILVAAGTWLERIDFLGKDLVLESVAGPEATVIDGEDVPGWVVVVGAGTDGDSAIRGFTITGGRGSVGSGGDGPGGGITVSGATFLIEDCVVTGNTGIDGAGISTSGGSVTVRDATVSGNAGFHGGGLWTGGGTIVIEDSAFEGNTAGFSGGGASFVGADVTVRGARFAGNSADQFGSGFFASHAELDMRDIVAEDNGSVIELGGGVLNFQSFAGGGFYTTDTNGRIDGIRLAGNASFAGSACYVAGDGATLEIVNALMTASITGNGVVYCNGSSPRLVNTTIAGNDAVINVFTTFNAEPTILNSVIDATTNSHGVATGGNGETIIRWSLVSGGLFSALPGEGVIEGPTLLDPANDFAPLPGSPAIDAGDNLSVPEGVIGDLLGNERFFDDPDTVDGGNGTAPIVDLGAIEVGAPPLPEPGGLAADMNGDGTVGMGDLLMVLAAFGPCEGCPQDLDGDGMVGFPDVLEILEWWGTSVE